MNLTYSCNTDANQCTQLRNVSRKLDSDLQSNKRRLAELVDQCNALKKGREESVRSIVSSFMVTWLELVTT